MKQQTQTAAQTIFPAMRYVDPRAAIEFLEKAFDAKRAAAYDGPNGTIAHAEMEIAGNLVMFGGVREDDEYPVRSPRQVGATTASIYIVLPSAEALDAMHRRAAAAGARILRAPYDTEYESREFSALDLDGHPWTFGTYNPRSG